VEIRIVVVVVVVVVFRKGLEKRVSV